MKTKQVRSRMPEFSTRACLHSTFQTCLLISAFLLTTILFPHTVHAQDYTQLQLPEGAKVRIGKGDINDIKFSPDGNLVAVAGSIGVWLYNAQTGAEVALLTGHTQSILSVAFSPDSKTLASGSSDTTIRLWDVERDTINFLSRSIRMVSGRWRSHRMEKPLPVVAIDPFACGI